jgi:hypothetical protein
MPKHLITTLGILIALMPAIAIPSSFKDWVYIVLGLSIAGANYYQLHYKKKLLKEIALRRSKKVGPTTPVSQESSIPAPLAEVAAVISDEERKEQQ